MGYLLLWRSMWSLCGGCVRQGREQGERSRQARNVRRLALLPVIGVGALVFAVPANAADQLVPPSPPVATYTDRFVTIVADVPDENVAPAVLAVPVEASAPAASPEQTAVSDDAVTPAETPANDAPAAVVPAPPPPAQAAAPAASAVISAPEPAPAVAPLPVASKPALKPGNHRTAKQYQSPRRQYQTVRVDGRRPNASRAGRVGDSPLPHGVTISSSAWIRARESTKNTAWNCIENSPESSSSCASDICPSATWNCCWIDSCTSGIPVVEVPSTPSVPEPAPGTTPVTCTDGAPLGTQYQSGPGQYQPPFVPAQDLGGDCAADAPVVTPVVPVSSPSPASVVVGVGSGQIATVTRTPIVAPVPTEVVPETPPPPDRQPSRTTPTGTEPQNTSVSSSPPLASAGEVLGETVSPRTPQRTPTVVPHPKRQVRSAKSAAQTASPIRRVAAPRPVALEAPSEVAARGGAPLTDWLLFGFAASLALGLSGFAVVAWTRPNLPALSALRSRLGSRGLSANARDMARSRGIRYRDP